MIMLTAAFLFMYLFLVVLGLHCCMRAFSSFGDRGLLSFQCVSFSLQGRLLPQSMSSRGMWASANWWCSGSVVLRHLGSSWIGDRTHVPWVARQILNQWTTREARMSALYGESGSLAALGDDRAGPGSSVMKPHV